MNRIIKGILLSILCILLFSISGCLSDLLPTKPDKNFTLQDLKGNTFTLSANVGKPIILCFFLATCPHCANEVPSLNAIFTKYKDTHNLLVVGIGVGSGIPEFAQNQGVTYPVLLDLDQSVADLYNVRSVPHNVFINKNGKIIREEIGELTEAELELFVQEIL